MCSIHRNNIRIVILTILIIATVGSRSLFALPRFLSSTENPSYVKSAAMKLRKLQTFDGFHKGSFAPDSKLLALMDKDHTDVIEASTGRKLYRIALPKSLFLTVAFSPDGHLLATSYLVGVGEPGASEKVTLWDALTGKEIRTLIEANAGSSRVNSLTFSRDGRLLAANVNGARIWEVTTGREIRHSPPSEYPLSV